MITLAQLADVLDANTFTSLSIIWVGSASLVTLFLLQGKRAVLWLKVLAYLFLVLIFIVHFMSADMRFTGVLVLMLLSVIELFCAWIASIKTSR